MEGKERELSLSLGRSEWGLGCEGMAMEKSDARMVCALMSPLWCSLCQSVAVCGDGRMMNGLHRQTDRTAPTDRQTNR